MTTIPSQDRNLSNHEIPRWPSRLREVCAELQSPRAGSRRDALIGEAWVLVKAAMSRYLRYHAARYGSVTAEDIEDLASQKTFDLLRKVELREWDLDGRQESEIQGFLSRVARNGLINVLRKGSREVHTNGENRSEQPVEASDGDLHMSEEHRPDVALERQEFVRELQRCVALLNERAQRVWFLRVFCEMSSKQIASHPDVRLEPGHVDVLMQRSRSKVKECMASKGLKPEDMPPGTFTALWKAVLLRMDWPV